MDLSDPPDYPERRYKTSRCAFRGGAIPPELLDPVFLNIAQRAAPIVTQNPGASVDDVLELLRTRSEYSDGLRIDSPHRAAAAYCGHLRDLLAAAVYHGLDGYPELRKFNPNKKGKLSKRGIALRGRLERFEVEFRELADKDQLAREAEVVRQNDAFARGLPIEKGKHGFSIEFPRQFDVDFGRGGGLPSGFAAGVPHLAQQLDFRERRHSLHQVGVPGEEELKNEFGRLAHAAIVAVTFGTSVPLATVDDWIDWLEHEGHHCNGDIGKLLILSRDYLSARSVNELGLGNLAKAEQLSRLAVQFGELLARFYKAVALAIGDMVEPVTETAEQRSERRRKIVDPQEIRAGIEAITAEHNAMFEAVNTETSNYPVRPAHDDKFARFEFFSLHANGLGLSQAGLNEALGKPGEWMRLFQIWKKTRRAPKPKKPSGAPKKPVADKTRALWAEMGKPTRLNKEVCDKLAQHSYPEEYAKTKLHSPARRTLRDRVARQVRVGIKHSAPTT